MAGSFIWPRVLHPRAYMTAAYPDLTRFARQVSPHPNPYFFPLPFWLRRGAEVQTDQGERLSERSEFELDPGWTEHHRLPGAKRRDADSRVAFSLVTFFW